MREGERESRDMENIQNKDDLKEAKVSDQINYDFLKKVEAPVVNDLYLRYIQEKNLAYYRKLLGDMKKQSRDLLDSGLFERASAKIERLIEKERKKKKEKTAPAAAEEEQKDNDVEKEPAEEEQEDNGDGDEKQSAKRSRKNK